MAVRKTGYQRFYVDKKDVPENLGRDTALIYKQPERIYGYDDLNPMATFNMKGINYQNTQKEALAMNLVFVWKQMEALKRELTSERVKNKILTSRLVQHNINTTLTPEEIEEYEFNLADILTREMNMTMEGDIADLKKEILSRVRKEINKAEFENGNNYKFNIVRINNFLKYNDILLEELSTARGKQMNQKDRIKLTLELEKSNRENMNKLKEIIKDVGMNLKEESKTVEEKEIIENNTTYNKPVLNYSSMLKKEGE